MAAIDVPAPMAGSVKEVLVAVGEIVTAGEEILILESMKMEIPVESPAAGSVREIFVEAADLVEEGQLLMRLGS